MFLLAMRPLALFLLLLACAALALLTSPVDARPMLISSTGYSLQQPLLLQGRNVGDALSELLSRVDQQEERAEEQQQRIDAQEERAEEQQQRINALQDRILEQQQRSDAQQTRIDEQQQQIDELLRRNSSTAALLQQYEQRFEQLQQTINEQQTRIDQQQTHIEGIQSNSTLILPGGGSSTVVEVVTQQQSVLTQLVQQNATFTQVLVGVGEQIDELGDQDALLAQKIQQLNSSTTAALDQHSTQINQLFDDVRRNNTLSLPGGGSSTVVEVVTQQQTLLEQLIERNNTVERVLSGVGEQIEQLGETDAQLAQQLQQLNSSTQQQIDQHSDDISLLNTKVDALLTPTVVHAVAGSEQATVRWSLGSATVTAYPGGATCVTDGLGGEQQCTVGGLTNGVNYTFTAQLTNAAGSGPVSPRSNSVVPQLDCFALTVATTGDGGVVTASPANSANCPIGEYVSSALVTLTAIPDAGFGVSWSGPSGGVADAALLTFTLPVSDAAATVVVAFAECFALNVDVMVGSGSAAIAAPSNSAGCAVGSFLAGTSVTLKAAPAAGWSFNGWSGTVSAGFGAAVWSFVMPAAAATQRASFAQCLPLTVSRQPTDGSGGSVSRSPSNSDGCPPGRYLQGDVLTLTATPAAGWALVGWTGVLNSTDATWSYTMGSATAVQTAVFGQCLALTLQVSGSGTVSAAPTKSPGCTLGQYVPGAAITLTGSGIAGWTLTGWTGTQVRSSDASAWAYTMPAAAATQTAQFAQCYQLTLGATGPAGGVTSASPSFSFACAAGRYVSGAALTLSATAPSGATFLRWSGSGASGTSSPLSYTMPTAAASVTAELAACVQVTAATSGSGGVTMVSAWPHSCPASQFPVGAPMTLTAAASAGSSFTQWAGSFTGTSSTLSFTMPATVTTLAATFVLCVQLTTSAAPVGSAAGSVSAPTSTWSHTCAAGRWPQGAPMSVTATAGSGSTFSQWTGTYSGASSTLTFTMPATAATVSATFKACRLLTLTASGCGTVGPPSPAMSFDCPAGRFAEGSSITVPTTASASCSFSQWSGASTSTAATLTFTVSASDAALQANFKQCYALSLPTAGTAGTVTANPTKSLACAAGSFVAGEAVSLSPASDGTVSTFRAWSGDASGSTSPLAFTMPAAFASVTATFVQCVQLTASAALLTSATGSVSAPTSTWSHTCTAGRWPQGAPMSVTATAGAGSTFAQWTGTYNSLVSTLTFTMSGTSVTLSADIRACRALTLTANGCGTVNSPIPATTFDCPAGRFAEGVSLTISTTASASCTFSQWSGAATSAGAILAFTVPASDAALQANFKQCYALTLGLVNPGTSSVSQNPTKSLACATGSYVAGEAVSFSVIITAPSTFRTWSDDASGTANPLVFTMPTRSASVTANFATCVLVVLTPNQVGGATGSISATTSWTHACAVNRFPEGAPMTVTAVAGAGSSFTQWAGSFTGSSTALSFTMPATVTTLTATFVPCVQLTVSAAPASGATGSVSAPTSTWSHTCTAGRWPQGAPVTVQATAGSLSSFTQWTDGNTNNPRTLTMPAAALTLSATLKACRLLTLTASGCGTVGSPSPATSFSCPAGRFVEGTSVSISVTASATCTFSQWSGASTSAVAPLSFTIPTSDASLQATFKQCYTLSLPTVGTAGTVTSNPTKSLACASGSFVTGEVVALTPASDGTLSTFRTWSGGASGTTSPLAFTMPAAAASVTATFVACLQLTTASVSTGTTSSVLDNPTSTWSHSCAAGRWPVGAPITAKVTVDTGTTFLDWTGGISSTANPVTFTMSASTTSITCRLAQCFSLTVNPGTGGTVATPAPASSGTCSAGSYPPGVAVTLTATPNSGYTFSQWSGAATSSAATLVFTTAAGARTLTATFAPQCYTLTRTSLNPSFGSIGTPSPPNSVGCAAGTFMAGASISVTAVPGTYYVLVQWSGAASGTSLTTSITMPTGGATVQASFKQRDFVYGQAAFSQSAGGSGLNSLNGAFGVAVGLSDELYVADAFNSRVLMYAFGSLTPTRVLGQADFIAKLANRGLSTCAANTLYSPFSVKIDTSGAVYVVDRSNNRVLYFPPNADTATRVYGQLGDFTTAGSVRSANSLSLPSDMALGDGGVFIADTYNHRVMYYAGTSTFPSRLYGQVSYTVSTANLKGPTGLFNPRSVTVDSTGGLYVGDFSNNRIVFFPKGQTTATRVIGQADFNSFDMNRGLTAPTAASLSSPQNIVVRSDGLYVVDMDNKRVLRFPVGGGTADRVWGQGDFVTKALQPIGDGVFNAPIGVILDSRGYMYVSDSSWHRVLRFAP